jgi:hypothetical protein
MINPKALDIKTLPWLPLEEKAAFPKKPAIYFAIDSQGTVQYIGRSVNVRHRWGSHHKYDVLSEIGNVKIAYLFVDTVELLPKIEAALIEWFKPPLNNSLSSFTNTSEKINFNCEPCHTKAPNMGKTERVSVVMPSELKKKLETLCKLENRSMSNMVTTLIQQAVTQAEEESRLPVDNEDVA